VTTIANSSLATAAARTARLGAELRRDPAAFRVLTGDRPTGPLHIGHYFGTLENRVHLQRLGVELFVLIADYQTLTDREASRRLPRDVLEQLADYLAIGIDPGRATIFAHSAVPELGQLVLPFMSLVTVAELARNPTVKAEAAADRGHSMRSLMLAYPVHQAADILSCRANVVPVGRDQLPHLELARTIARRFNERYGDGVPVLPEPQALLGSAPLLLGTDGTKMSTSRGNAIALGAGEDETARLIRAARTDAERRITFEPARRPEISNLVLMAALFRGEAPQAIADQVGDRGAAALKRLVTEAANEHLRPIRRRRAELLRDPGQLLALLRAGNRRARATAADTLLDVRRHMHMTY
jgi:tryptophanyl-tRNA synthetase